MTPGDFHFLRPLWLLTLPGLIPLLWWWRRRRPPAGPWVKICDPALLPHVLVNGSPHSGGSLRKRDGLFGLGWALAIFALAGPAWERLPQPVFRDQSALVIILDLSRSMDATDIKPSRLERARFKIADLLARRREGQTALMVYAARAFTVTPLTDDVATITSQLPVLSTDLMPAQGSNAVAALRKAAELFEQAGVAHGDVLWVTGGVADVQGEAIRDRLGKFPHRLSILGVGTEDGAPIPAAGGGHVKDDNGRTVMSRLRAAALTDLAARGGGHYQRLAADDSDVDTLDRYFRLTPLKADVRRTDVKSERWREEGPWLLPPLLPLAAMAFRRGAVVMLLIAVLPASPPAAADDGRHWWLRPDQQAARTLAGGDAHRAAGMFSDPAWKAAAHYRSGEYEQAVKALAGRDSADDDYNRGNALAQLGRYQEALAAYDKSLAADPGSDDARYNRDVVRRLLDKQTPPPSSAGDRSKEDQDRQGQRSQQQSGGGADRESPDPSRNDSQDQQSNPQPSDKAHNDAKDKQKPGSPRPSQPSPRERTQNDTGKSDDQTRQDAKAGQEPTAGNPDRDRADHESEQAYEQWLRRIPDDPGGLLRRKFLYQYRQAYRDDGDNSEPW